MGHPRRHLPEWIIESSTKSLARARVPEFHFLEPNFSVGYSKITERNSPIFTKLRWGNEILWRILKCLSSVTRYSALAAKAQSTNLLSSGSSAIKPRRKCGSTKVTFLLFRSSGQDNWCLWLLVSSVFHLYDVRKWAFWRLWSFCSFHSPDSQSFSMSSSICRA